MLAEAYLPGWKAGGPIRSLSNLVSALGEAFEFSIITRDRDHNDAAPYAEVQRDQWTRVGRADVYYGTRDTLSLRRLAKQVNSAEPDLVVVTGYFSSLAIVYLLLRRLGSVKKAPTLIAPQGQFDRGALALGAMKKRLYVLLSRLSGLTRGVDWQASTEDESARIRALFPRAETHVASDIPKQPESLPAAPPTKSPGSLTLVFISRISPKKNLAFLLDLLPEIEGRVDLQIYGPREPDEWRRLEKATASVPDHIEVTYGGILPHKEVNKALADCHFFVLPTLGENFGHAIYESLRAGRPVVISDRTPWRDLAKEGAGWDLALEDRNHWIGILQRCVDLDSEAYLALSHSAHDFASRWFSQSNHVDRQAEVYNTLIPTN